MRLPARPFVTVSVSLVLATAWVALYTLLRPVQPGLPPTDAGVVLRDYQPVTAERLKNPEADDWLMIRRTYDGWGHSPLAQINTDNVARLQPGGADRQRWRHVRLDAQH